MKKSIRVKILDRDYLIRSEEDEEKVQEIAEYLDERAREIRENTEGLSESKIAMLAAFHIASDYFQIKKEHSDLTRKVHQRAQSLNRQIDALMG